MIDCKEIVNKYKTKMKNAINGRKLVLLSNVVDAALTLSR